MGPKKSKDRSGALAGEDHAQNQRPGNSARGRTRTDHEKTKDPGANTQSLVHSRELPTIKQTAGRMTLGPGGQFLPEELNRDDAVSGDEEEDSQLEPRQSDESKSHQPKSSYLPDLWEETKDLCSDPLTTARFALLLCVITFAVQLFSPLVFGRGEDEDIHPSIMVSVRKLCDDPDEKTNIVLCLKGKFKRLENKILTLENSLKQEYPGECQTKSSENTGNQETQLWVDHLKNLFQTPEHLTNQLTKVLRILKKPDTVTPASETSDCATRAVLKTLFNRLDRDAKTTKRKSIGNIKTLQNTLTGVIDRVDTVEKWRGGIETEINQIRLKIENYSKDVAAEFKVINGNITGMQSNVSRLQNDAQHIALSVGILNTNITSLNSDVTNLGRDHNNNKNRLEIQDENISKMRVNQYQSTETQEDLRKKANVQTFMNLLVVLVIVWVLVLTAVSLRRPGKEGRLSSTLPILQKRSHVSVDKSACHNLKWTKPLENGICIISFHAETERKHREFTESVFPNRQRCPKLLESRIHRHANIEQLPGAKMYLVFVDFNERNVILENPEKGLGDLRLTTVRSLWKFGGDITLIYCGDRGSKDLREGELFNRELTSIYSHTELSQLKNEQKMMSISDKFTDFQRSRLREIIGHHFP